jgi:hypothetical protein
LLLLLLLLLRGLLLCLLLLLRVSPTGSAALSRSSLFLLPSGFAL